MKGIIIIQRLVRKGRLLDAIGILEVLLKKHPNIKVLQFLLSKLHRQVDKIVDMFHKLYHSSPNTWANTFWLGIPTIKCPLDLWIYQEIIFEIRPDIIIECGTALGGSALFLASLCDLINSGKVITIDINKGKNMPTHKRIKYMVGSSVSQEIVEELKSLLSSEDKVMVFLDSDHQKDHVLNELRIYSKFVTKGSYLIIEDTNINGHPVVYPPFGAGPMEAIEEFFKENNDFIVDRSKEKFYLTFNPRGYLRKVKSSKV